MSDYGAFAGAQMLAQQLRGDRFLDDLENNRAYAELAQDYQRAVQAANNLSRSNTNLVNKYNRLNKDFNDLVATFNDLVTRNEQQAGMLSQLKSAEANGSAKIDQLAEDLRRSRAEVEGFRLALKRLLLLSGSIGSQVRGA